MYKFTYLDEDIRVTLSLGYRLSKLAVVPEVSVQRRLFRMRYRSHSRTHALRRSISRSRLMYIPRCVYTRRRAGAQKTSPCNRARTVPVYVTYLVSAAAIGSICCKCQMERAPTHVPIQPECRRMKTREREIRVVAVLRWRTRVSSNEIFASRRSGRSFLTGQVARQQAARMIRGAADVTWSLTIARLRRKEEEEKESSRPVLHSASSELWTARCRGTSSGKKTRSLVTRG